MKIYAFPYDKNSNWPTEYVWLDMDYSLASYKPEEYDRDLKEYLCKVHRGEYMRLSFKRRYLMAYVEINSIKELISYCKESFEKGDWFEIAWRDGVMQFDPWAD